VAGRDITEGRAERAIAVDVGVTSSTAVWQNTDVAYDVALGGIPFIYAISDNRPYIRQTAPFKKDQFDNGQEPGEQSLTGWWLRSQMSFHSGAGIKFFDPATTDEKSHYRFADSKGVDVWTKGQATLLSSCTEGHVTTGALSATGRPVQQLRSIKWNSTSGALLHDGYDVDKIPADTPNSPIHFIDYNAGSAYPVYAVCDDGTYAYWITKISDAGVIKTAMYKKPLTGSSADTSDEVQMWKTSSVVVANAVMEYVKERIVLCLNNAVYEVPSSATALPTALYTHPATTHTYSTITASGPAIYVAGYNGIQSTIQKFTLSTAGVMPTLTSAVVAAEMPVGEVIHKIFYYLGYLMIGTSKGFRAAVISDQDGSINYGPLIVETSQPCFDFAARDHFVWCATSVAGEPGVIRVDLSNELETLRFAWANDIYYDGVSGFKTTSCAFADGTDRLVFCTANDGTTDGHVYVEDATSLRTTGYIVTGNIRYGTLEPKNFKRLLGRGDFTHGTLTLETVDKSGIEYDHISYDSTVSPIEVGTSNPATAQEYVAFKFVLTRDATDPSQGPIFMGYQAKATIATPRQRIIKFPVYIYDVETDHFDVMVGYEGRALERLQLLEDIEESGDVITWQDLTTKESRQAVIEQVSFTRLTPPDKNFNGFGGIAEITIRTV
jgi:hypothetical protein